MNGARELNVLKNLDFQLYSGEDICILGASGAGKSTFLHLLGVLDSPTEGEVYFRGKNLNTLSEDEKAHFRNEHIGFVFQFHHLLAELNALENVALPLRIAGESARIASKRAEAFLDYLHLLDRAHHFPPELSGGEQQRVAVARALIRQPSILLADEPTGNLDTDNKKSIQQLFFQLKTYRKLSLVIVTHDQNFADQFSQKKYLKDGIWAAMP